MDGPTQQSVGSRQEVPDYVLPAPLTHLYPVLPRWAAAAQPDSPFMEHSFTEPLLCARHCSLFFTSSCSKRDLAVVAYPKGTQSKVYHL